MKKKCRTILFLFVFGFILLLIPIIFCDDMSYTGTAFQGVAASLFAAGIIEALNIKKS